MIVAHQRPTISVPSPATIRSAHRAMTSRRRTTSAQCSRQTVTRQTRASLKVFLSSASRSPSTYLNRCDQNASHTDSPSALTRGPRPLASFHSTSRCLRASQVPVGQP